MQYSCNSTVARLTRPDTTDTTRHDTRLPVRRRLTRGYQGAAVSLEIPGIVVSLEIPGFPDIFSIKISGKIAKTVFLDSRDRKKILNCLWLFYMTGISYVIPARGPQTDNMVMKAS